MKRCSLFLCLIACLIFVGCGTSLTDEIQINLAECRNNFFIGETETAKINFASGLREEPYVLNGICEPQIEFGVITVKFLVNIGDYKSEPTYILTVNGNDYDGTLIKNPFDLTYVADINSVVMDDASISIKIIFESLVIEDNLTCISKDWKIKSNNVVKIGTNIFKNTIKNLKNSNGLNAEYYVKIIYDADFKLNQYYWYFSAFTKTGQIFSAVIDVNTGEILSTKNL